MSNGLDAQRVYPTSPAGPGMVWMANPTNTAWRQVPFSAIRDGKRLGYRVVTPRSVTTQGVGNPGSLFDTHGKPVVGSIGQRDVQRWAGGALAAAPTAGGVAGDVLGLLAAGASAPETGGGSLLAAPAAMALGAGLGQSAGRGLELGGRRLLGLPMPPNVEQSPAGIAKDLAGQFGWGAGTSLVGQGAGNMVVKPIAKTLMGAALRTADRPAIEAALAEGIRPGRSIMTGESGSQQVKAAADAARAKQSDALMREGGGMDPQPLFDKLEKMVAGLEKKATLAPELQADAQALRARFTAFRDQIGGGPIHPEDVQAMKQIYADMADPAYVAAQKNGPPVPMTRQGVMYSKMIADATRSWLRQNLGKAYTKPTKTLERLMALGPKMNAAEGKVPMPGAGVLFNVAKLLPQGATGQAALALNGPGYQAVRWAPWLMNYAANDKLGGQP